MLTAFLVFLVLILLYAMWGRAWLKAWPWAKPFFDWIGPIEHRLYQKSETMLIGRLLSLGSSLVMVHDVLAQFAVGLDWSPITNRLLSSVPEDLRGLVVAGFSGAIGLLIAWLRKRTTKPLDHVAKGM